MTSRADPGRPTRPSQLASIPRTRTPVFDQDEVLRVSAQIAVQFLYSRPSKTYIVTLPKLEAIPKAQDA